MKGILLNSDAKLKLLGIHRDIEHVPSNESDESVLRQIEERIKEDDFDREGDALKARYAELLLGLDGLRELPTAWRQWREVYARRFRAIEAVLKNRDNHGNDASDDDLSVRRLIRGVISAAPTITGFFHHQADRGLISSASYYSNSTMRFSELLSKRTDVLSGVRDIINPGTFLNELRSLHPQEIAISGGEGRVPRTVTVADVHRAFTVQHVLEDLINAARELGEPQPLRFSWNPARRTIEFTLSKGSPLIEAIGRGDEVVQRIREVDEHWWIEQVDGDRRRAVIPTYRFSEAQGDFHYLRHWQKVMDRGWSLLLWTALRVKRLSEGTLRDGEQELLVQDMEWMVGQARLLVETMRKSQTKTVERILVSEFVAKLNNFIGQYATFLSVYHDEECRMRYVPSLEMDVVNPLRRIKGSLEDAIPHLSIEVAREIPSVIPADLNHAHRFLDAFVLDAGYAAGPECSIRLFFSWDRENSSLVIEDPDGHMARRVESIRRLSHLHSDLSNEIITNAAWIAPKGAALHVDFSGSIPLIHVPMTAVSVG